MNIQQKKKQIEEEYKRNQELIQQLLARQEQLKGQYEILNEIEKEKKEKKKTNGTANNQNR